MTYVLCLLVKECVDHLSSDENEEKLVASLWGAERCLRVLESVSMKNLQINLNVSQC